MFLTAHACETSSEPYGVARTTTHRQAVAEIFATGSRHRGIGAAGMGAGIPVFAVSFAESPGLNRTPTVN
ncbi:MAG: hypothetical protein M0Z53_13210 [Thermaerobacter sp.]|nr:hypothetical protein [Thermaerobacter sp.]